jgi:hypothetical protein
MTGAACTYEAKIGPEHEVPFMKTVSPPVTISTLCACAAISGKPRPLELRKISQREIEE